MAPVLVSLQGGDQRRLSPGVGGDPEVGEGVGSDELLHLRLDQPVDCACHRADQRLQARPVGDDTGEHLVQERLDVDLCLDRVGDLGRDRRLDLG